MEPTIISISESLVITVFSMVIVFVGLLLISFIIGLLKNLNKFDKKKQTEPVKEKKVSKPVEVVDETNDEELVAVIAAAIASSLGVGMDEIVVRDIRRVDNNVDSWTNAGLNEQMLFRL